MALRRPSPAVLAALALALVLGACRDDQVTAYRVPKEKDPALPGAADAGSPQGVPPPGGPAAGSDASGGAAPVADGPGGPMAGMAVPTASASLVWTAPGDWTSRPPSAMRKATYEVPGPNGAKGDLAITAFPGDVGGEVANVNRWRGQVGMQPLPPAAASASLVRMQAGGFPVAILDVSAAASAGDHRILGAMVSAGGATWFFKLSGPSAVVAGAKPAFLAFIRTVHAP